MLSDGLPHLTISTADAVNIFELEPALADQFFTRAFRHGYLRGRDGRNLTMDPCRAMLLGHRILVLSADAAGRLMVVTFMPFPPHLVDGQGRPVPEPSVDDLVELLSVGQFDVEVPQQIRFRFRNQMHQLRIEAGYTRCVVFNSLRPPPL